MTRLKVTVSFNGLRLNLANAFNNLTDKLSRSLHIGYGESRVVIDKDDREDIIDELNNLRQFIGAMLALYCNELDFRDLSEEVKLLELDKDEVEDE